MTKFVSSFLVLAISLTGHGAFASDLKADLLTQAGSDLSKGQCPDLGLVTRDGQAVRETFASVVANPERLKILNSIVRAFDSNVTVVEVAKETVTPDLYSSGPSDEQAFFVLKLANKEMTFALNASSNAFWCTQRK